MVNRAHENTFFSGIKIKTVPTFGHKQISSPHYRKTHFYTILYYFKHLKKNHTKHNHLYSSPLNYTYPYTSISVHANYNNLYAPSQIYNYKKINLKELGHFFFRHKNKNSSHFRTQANFITPLPYHPIFYTILKYFKHLKRNHANIITNTHPCTSISIHTNYNHL